jgi:hypothetical protein
MRSLVLRAALLVVVVVILFLSFASAVITDNAAPFAFHRRAVAPRGGEYEYPPLHQRRRLELGARAAARAPALPALEVADDCAPLKPTTHVKYTVQGNRVVNATGHAVWFHGVDRPSLEVRGVLCGVELCPPLRYRHISSVCFRWESV